MPDNDFVPQPGNTNDKLLATREEHVESNAEKQPHWCFSWFAMDHLTCLTERAALVKNAKWPIGSNISISFLDGSVALQKKVEQITKGWTAPGRANIQFIFRKDTTATDIRISFKYKGSWSVIGTTCRKVTNLAIPTMNFGWLTEDLPDEDARRVVLHEFGHALGLIHEHQNPAGGIQWDKDAVIESLSGPPNNWTEETIEKNMFTPYNKSETNYTDLDVLSIMTYPIPPEWTMDGFSIELNKDLSETDKKFIKQQYP